LVAAVADMRIFDEIDATYVGGLEEYIEKATLIIADGNLSTDAFRVLGELCLRHRKPFYFEPTSDHKCLLPLLVNPSSLSASLWSNGIQLVDFLKPNLSELMVMVKYILDSSDRNSMLPMERNYSDVHKILSKNCDENILGINDIKKLAIVLHTALCSTVDACAPLKAENKKTIVSLGERGCLLVTADIEGSTKNLRTTHFPIPEDPSGNIVVNTSGAGDCLFAGVVHQIISHENDFHKVVEYGLQVSRQSLMSPSAVPDTFY